MNNFQSLPTITKNILIINILLYASTWLLKAKGLDLTNFLGLNYPTAPNFRTYQFITFMFMHGSIMHIFFNMYAVFMFGAILENVWEPKRFLFYYIFTGLGAAVIQLLVYYFQLMPDMNRINEVLDQVKDFSVRHQITANRDAQLNQLIVIG